VLVVENEQVLYAYPLYDENDEVSMVVWISVREPVNTKESVLSTETLL
jgi:hypothetical protein